jgi:hypothetical protein
VKHKERARPIKGKSIAVAVMLVALAVFRVYLPTLVKRTINGKLDKLDGFHGSIGSVGLSLWRGAYQIGDLMLTKQDGAATVPVFSCRKMDLSLEWGALLHGAFVGRLALDTPVLNVSPRAADVGSQAALEKNGTRTVDAIAPLPVRLDRLDVRGGEIHFVDKGSKPSVDIFLKRITATATNLSSTRDTEKLLPSEVRATAECFDSGTLTLHLAVDPLNESPTFELQETMSGVKLVNLNDFLEAYAKFKVKDGDFSLYTEIAAKNGSFIGYAKPIIHNLAIEKGKKKTKTPLRRVWAHVVAAAAEVLSNPKKDQVATKIPIEGPFGTAKVGVWSAVGGLLKNAFVKALLPTIDHTISITDAGKMMDPSKQ